MLAVCHHCQLPVRLHFCFCFSSGIKGAVPANALKPGAIQSDPRELRYCKPVDPAKLKAWKRLL